MRCMGLDVFGGLIKLSVEIIADSISGVLYDVDGNKLAKWGGITAIESEEPSEIEYKETYYNNVANVRFSGKMAYPTYNIFEKMAYWAYLTKKQNHLRKYGRPRVRKKYKNKVLKIMRRNLRNERLRCARRK